VSLTSSELQVLMDRLRLEDELAAGAAVASDAAAQFDRNMARLLTCGDPAVVAAALARLDDETPVQQAQPPHDPLEGGYGRHFGQVTVGDKARFLLKRVLGREWAEAAIAQGPAWCQGRPLRWDAKQGRFE
jgi:hypothetical protein